MGERRRSSCLVSSYDSSRLFIALPRQWLHLSHVEDGRVACKLFEDVKPAMAGSADGFVVWKDFPRGLRILILDKDAPSAVETKSKLEEMDYIVSLYHNEEDALEAISKEAESFHVAVVEVTTIDSCGSFRFLEMAKDIPTIVVSDVHCLSTMMKCIALGAAEFLQKPVAEDKLRNIWQHVVHKAFNAGGNELSKSLKPIKDTVVSMLKKHSETDEHKIKEEESEKDDKYGSEKTMTNDRFSAPSTPQPEQGKRFPTNGEFQEMTHCSIAKELPQPRKHSSSVSKSVGNTCDNSVSIAISKDVLPSKAEAEEEVNSVDGSKTDECSAVKEGFLPSHFHSVDGLPKNRLSHSDGARNNRKKMKVDWTPELHRQFVQAVEQLGIDQAIPSKIVELMKVEGLTRHNVASHLQVHTKHSLLRRKYRMHRRHVLPKDADRRWQADKDPTQRGYIPRPVLAYPPNHPKCGAPTNQIYPFWVHPNYHSHGVQASGQAGYTRWHPPPQSWPWKTYPVVHADAWGCPVFATQYGQYPMSSPIAQLQRSLLYGDFDTSGDRLEMSQESYGVHQVEEAIDRAIKDVMRKPRLPLPLGLKSPSAEAVLAELHRQGICTIPPSAPSTDPPHSCG
ncbi:Two-component response [Musa troglodytarum]|uniref:Two-component response n=1 Tax=Musa troglodytarum TaxID=320322 RepID=A0A9E7JM02_9LILI|nr:Two-component response [Musa troglodytarum]